MLQQSHRRKWKSRLHRSNKSPEPVPEIQIHSVFERHPPATDEVLHRPPPHRTCLLLTRVPAEVREIIYGYALSIACVVVGHFFGYTEPLTYYKPGQRSPTKIIKNDKLLSLPLTCRTIYNESIAYLYIRNAFWFRWPLRFLNYEKSLAQRHFYAIRSVTIDFDIEVAEAEEGVKLGKSKERQEVFQILGKMRHLQHLRLILDIWDWNTADWNGPFVSDRASSIFKPLVDLKHVKETEVELCQKCIPMRNTEAWKTNPFDVIFFQRWVHITWGDERYIKTSLRDMEAW